MRERESDMKGRERENARGHGGCVRDPPAALDPFPLVYTPMGATRSTNLRNLNRQSAQLYIKQTETRKIA